MLLWHTGAVRTMPRSTCEVDDDQDSVVRSMVVMWNV